MKEKLKKLFTLLITIILVGEVIMPMLNFSSNISTAAENKYIDVFSKEYSINGYGSPVVEVLVDEEDYQNGRVYYNGEALYLYSDVSVKIDRRYNSGSCELHAWIYDRDSGDALYQFANGSMGGSYWINFNGRAGSKLREYKAAGYNVSIAFQLIARGFFSAGEKLCPPIRVEIMYDDIWLGDTKDSVKSNCYHSNTAFKANGGTIYVAKGKTVFVGANYFNHNKNYEEKNHGTFEVSGETLEMNSKSSMVANGNYGEVGSITYKYSNLNTTYPVKYPVQISNFSNGKVAIKRGVTDKSSGSYQGFNFSRSIGVRKDKNSTFTLYLEGNFKSTYGLPVKTPITDIKVEDQTGCLQGTPSFQAGKDDALCNMYIQAKKERNN